jgi:hypothetical protein
MNNHEKITGIYHSNFTNPILAQRTRTIQISEQLTLNNNLFYFCLYNVTLIKYEGQAGKFKFYCREYFAYDAILLSCLLTNTFRCF